ncbi:hypothetical protein BASA50_008730 [Batrachochytrium salamandrivorans]|uniref:Uncharacterized protein n=1 Tax=Batrachochytrium salamandrivorans TaxID=1357716 RepID=A0ABQ8F3D7_9FUNG|nr:hypothetical protein BASA60_003346 [Batrachochytrium salamandrivorans]KAH6589252.1 hypothetical protein BASA61_005691 [Batrachochytrium salamandrivorans]KAH6591376.1 hypothetical protein BASA50_008730 [Batrachochytrium salamandrivorans]KAH9269770.1 hypothetical protein BASA83_008085 [Batrachochytrium salamandrivorans]
MKLISLAALSLLAITVSAQPPQGATSQDSQSHQGAAAQDLPPSCQDPVQEKLKDLEADYQAKQALVLEIRDFSTEIQEEADSKLEVVEMKEKMKRKDTKQSERLVLQEQFDAAAARLKGAYDAIIVKKRQLKKAMEECDTAGIKLITLKEHNRKITEHNANNQDQIVLVPGFYNKQILVEQFEEVCQYSKDLLLGNNYIENGIYEVDMAINSLKISEGDDLEKISIALSSYHKILWKRTKYTKKHCNYLKKLRKNPSWQAGGIC